MLKKLTLLTASLLLSGCVFETSQFTVASDQPLNLTGKHQYKVGKEVEGTEYKPVVPFFAAPVHLGNPSPDKAIHKALAEEKCAVGLTNVTAQLVSRHLGFGIWGWKVNGNLLIDTTKPGCNK